ncbi:MAG: hypothetical protein C4589_04855 [Peptococcaceae bacterium]|jgi:hypothetical protein|nr:MAG: hypothetical protein C4589_04855 [Peptococcaceae bacterium]
MRRNVISQGDLTILWASIWLLIEVGVALVYVFFYFNQGMSLPAIAEIIFIILAVGVAYSTLFYSLPGFIVGIIISIITIIYGIIQLIGPPVAFLVTVEGYLNIAIVIWLILALSNYKKFTAREREQ